MSALKDYSQEELERELHKRQEAEWRTSRILADSSSNKLKEYGERCHICESRVVEDRDVCIFLIFYDGIDNRMICAMCLDEIMRAYNSEEKA